LLGAVTVFPLVSPHGWPGKSSETYIDFCHSVQVPMCNLCSKSAWKQVEVKHMKRIPEAASHSQQLRGGG